MGMVLQRPRRLLPTSLAAEQSRLVSLASAARYISIDLKCNSVSDNYRQGMNPDGFFRTLASVRFDRAQARSDATFAFSIAIDL